MENAQQLALLYAEGCDEAQGFYLRRPIAADQLRAPMHISAHKGALAAVTDCPTQAMALIL